MAKKSNGPRFIATFPLKTEKWQEDIINKRFEIGRRLYNSILDIALKRYKRMTETEEYRSLMERLKTAKPGAEKKEISSQIKDLKIKHRFTEYDLHKDITPMRQHFATNIDAASSQKLASSVWKAMDAIVFRNGKKAHFKRYGELNSMEGNTNSTGIKFKDGFLHWNPGKAKRKLAIPVIVDERNIYQFSCLEHEICYCRILRKLIRGKYKYYVQMVLKGTPPAKYDKETGEVKNYVGKGDVGLDIGTSTIAISSESDVRIVELADKVQNIENEKRRLQRKMDRSRRAMNPDNFNEDGTVKKQGSKKVRWVNSNRYMKYRNELRELQRKQAAVRKLQHECLANYIISLGDKIYVEKMQFSGLQRRAKETKTNDKGKFKSKKRFGKTLANRAPAMLLEIIDRKLHYYGLELIKINTFEVKASQYNHFDQTYTKKKLSQRWNDFNDMKIQRDMYSAFLIMNVDETLTKCDQDKCDSRFEKFKQFHDLEVERLSGCKNLSSIGI